MLSFKDPDCHSFTAESESSGLTSCEMGSLADSPVSQDTDTVQIFIQSKVMCFAICMAYGYNFS